MGISHNLRRIQGRSQIFGKFRFVDNGDGRCRNDLLSRFTSRIVGRYARIASCRNHGNIDAQLQGFQARPAPRTLLACRINDFIDNIAVRQVVFFRKNIGGNTDEETLQFPLIPLVEGFGNFPIRKLAYVFHEQVRFGNQLHIRIFNTVMYHFYKMTGPVFTDISAARFSVIGFRRNSFVHVLYFRITFLMAAGHNSRTATSARFTARNTHTVEMDALSLASIVTTARIFKERVAAVNDDISFFQQPVQRCQHAVYRCARHNHEHDFTRTFQRLDKLFQIIIRRNSFMRPFGNKLFRQIGRVIVYSHVKPVVGHI